MYAVDICEGSGERNMDHTNGTMMFKFKDCHKEVDFRILTEVMFKLDKYPDKMTYDEYLVYAVMVEL